MAEKKIVPRLTVQSLCCSYDNTAILKGVDLALSPGATLAIVGLSGCGKTTLLKCLSLLHLASGGHVLLDGKPYISEGKLLCPAWQIRQQIVMVFQDYNLFPNMSCMRNITLALEKAKGLSRKAAEEVAIAVADQLGIAGILQRYPNSLSGGQAQRLALARAMVLQPKVLLLDEITSGLDPQTIKNVVNAIYDLRRTDVTGQLAIIFVTHLMQFAADFADQVAFFHEGKIAEELPAKSFFTDCQLLETKNFLASVNVAD